VSAFADPSQRGDSYNWLVDNQVRGTRQRLSATHVLLSLFGWGIQALFGLVAFASGLIAPPVGVAIIIFLWCATAVVSLTLWRRAPWVALACGLGAAALILATITIGDLVFGWTA